MLVSTVTSQDCDGVDIERKLPLSRPGDKFYFHCQTGAGVEEGGVTPNIQHIVTGNILGIVLHITSHSSITQYKS